MDGDVVDDDREDDAIRASQSSGMIISAPRETGAKAYMIAVAPVIRETSCCQLGAGARKTMPKTVATMIDQTGTPRLETRVRALGRPSA